MAVRVQQRNHSFPVKLAEVSAGGGVVLSVLYCTTWTGRGAAV